MKVLILIFSMVMTGAAQANSDFQSELGKIETAPDLCSGIVGTNKLIQLGDSAVSALVSVLESPAHGHKSKWAAAMALGEIGSVDAIPTLTSIADKNGPDSFHSFLGNVSREAIAKLNGEAPKQGKFHLITYGEQTLRTDCETGIVEIMK